MVALCRRGSGETLALLLLVCLVGTGVSQTLNFAGFFPLPPSAWPIGDVVQLGGEIAVDGTASHIA